MLVDHPHVIQPSVHGTRHEKRHQELGEIHHKLKALAVELNIPVVVFAPLACSVASRGAKRPQGSDSRGSAAEKAIDHVLFLYRDELCEPEAESKNVIIGRIVITKHQYRFVIELDVSI